MYARIYIFYFSRKDFFNKMNKKMSTKTLMSLVAIWGILTLSSCTDDNYTKTKSDADYIVVEDGLEGIKEIENFIKPYHDTVESRLNKTLSYTKNVLWTARKKSAGPESPLGDLLSDLVYEQANNRYKKDFNKEVDFVVLNRGGIRTTIGKGNITLRQMFEIMPFENTLLVVTIGPEKMQEFLDYMAKSNGHPISHIRLKVKDQKAFDVTIGGKPFDATKSYKIVTTDYLQHGGDKMYFFSDPISIDTLKYKMRDAMIDYFEKTDTVDVKIDGRFSYAE
jgi:5'-nucleotidase